MEKWLNGAFVEMTQQEIEEYNQRQTDYNQEKIPRLKETFSQALQTAIDNKAREKNYNNSVYCASYKDSTVVQWASEAAQFIAWRDQCWTIAFQKLAEFEAGTIPEPTIDEFLAFMPALIWS